MYMFRMYPIEFLTVAGCDYAAVSHAGHGVNSYALNYHVVRAGLGVFIQVAWGGVYNTDKDQPVERLSKMFRSCEELLGLVRGPLHPRLFVIESDLRLSGACEWIPKPLAGKSAAVSWLREHRSTPDPISKAVRLLNDAAI
jgi:hypothetical protein